LVVHAATEGEDAWRRSRGRRVVRTFLPVHELGGAPPPRHEAKRALGLEGREVALFFGHVRPFKGLDIALRAWPAVKANVTLLVAGEAWWDKEDEYRALAGVIPSREDGEGSRTSGAVGEGIPPLRYAQDRDDTANV